MSKLFRELLVALLIVFEVLSLWLTLFVARRLGSNALSLMKFKRLDLEFSAAGNPGSSLSWRRDKVKIGLYLALYAFYTAVALGAVALVSLSLLRAFGILPWAP